MYQQHSATSDSSEEDWSRRVRRFGFFPLMRQLECHYRQLPRLGLASSPGKEAVRVGQEPDLSFCAAELKAFRPASANHPARLTVATFGLFGPQGPLPLHLTEYAHARMHSAADHTWVDFLNLFQHRMACLYYRAWAAAQPVIAMDRPDDDGFARILASTCGLFIENNRAPGIESHALLHFAGLLIGRHHAAAGLRQILSQYFALPVAIEPFVGEYLALPASDRAAPLGRGLVLGARAWSRQHCFRIVFGPLASADAARLLPEQDACRRLCAWVRHYTGGQFDWQLELRLAPGAAARARLSGATRIGRNSWLGPPPDDARLRFNQRTH